MTDALDELRATLATDGYSLEVEQGSDTATVRITAADGVCDDCLVPKGILAAMLAPAIGIAADRIELHYPGEPA